jgi:hypothetical protein
MKIRLVFLLFGCCFSWTSGPAQNAGNVIPFQGQLANQTGQPLSPNNPVTLVFRFYQAPVGGAAIWEEAQPNVSVSAGRFSVLLGSRAALPDQSYFQGTLYLGITIDDGDPATADVELRPRQALVPVISARYAQNADKLGGYDWSGLFGTNNPLNGKILGTKIADSSITGSQVANGSLGDRQLAAGLPIPVGGVIMWWGDVSNLPANFELCDGAMPSTPGAALSSAKPDLRDRFVKGAPVGTTTMASLIAGGTNSIPERQTGGTAISIDQMPTHSHGGHTTGVDPFSGTDGSRDYNDNYTSNPGLGISYNGTRLNRANLFSEHQHAIHAEGGGQPHDHTIPAHDNRPAFLEMFYIIRVK